MVNPAGPTLFENCKLYDNHALNHQMAWYGGDAGAGALNVLTADPIIRHCEIYSNTSTGDQRAFGGGIAFYENSHAGRDQQHVDQREHRFGDGKRSLWGGIGMAKGASADRFEGNLIRDNRLTSIPDPNIVGLGGGICLSSTNSVTVTNNLIFNNRIDSMGIAFPRGGGIYANGLDSYLVNNTVVSNTALYGGQGGGVYLADGVLSNTVVVSNTALYFGTADGGGVFWAGGSVGYNDVWGNLSPSGADYATGGSPRPPTDISADPLFTDSGDLATRYHLQLNSPCIDAGSSVGLVPDQDYDGDLRPRGSQHDIGFDEVWVRRIYLPLVLRSY